MFASAKKKYGAVPTAESPFTSLSSSSNSAASSTPAGYVAAAFTAQSKVISAVFLAAAVSVGVGVGVTLSKSSSSPSTSPLYCDWSDYRLPQVASPTAYNLYWKPQFEPPFSFLGFTSIDLQITAETDCIFIHAASDLGITSLTWATTTSSSSSSSSSSSPLTYTYDATNQRLIIRLPNRTPLGTLARIDIGTSATLATNNVGLYLSQYMDDSGTEISMVATQFEATFARRAFPCFDEPAYKANFTIAVDGVPKGFTPLSNMPVLSTSLGSSTFQGNPTSLVNFTQTPRISTYLVALVVGPMISSSGVTTSGVNLTVFGVNRSATVGNLDYARNVAVTVLAYYEKLFNLPFPLPKSDMVAIPDFAAGAMENMGLITYRETALLANTVTSSASELQRVAVVVSHELAHQWFGDIVTMEYWNALWLNEGFASRTEYVGVMECCSGFEINRQFQSSDVFVALRADAFADGQALTQTVTSSAEIEAQFSSISYSKGATVLNMVEAYLNSNPAVFPTNSFYIAVNKYIVENQYANAEPSSLWAAFASVAGIPELVSWLTGYEVRPGYAVVILDWTTPELSEATGSGVLTISQSRYFASPYSASLAPAAAAAYTWWIPFSLSAEHPSIDGPVPAAIQTIAQASTTPADAFLTSTWTGVTIGTSANPYNISRDGFIKGNATTGYFRVLYPPSIWIAIATSAKQQVIANNASQIPLSNAERAQALDDLFSFAEGTSYRAKGINTTLALTFASIFLPYETTFEVWTAALSHLNTIYSVLIPDVPLAQAGDPTVSPFSSSLYPNSALCASSFAKFAQSQLQHMVDVLGFDNGDNSPLTVLLRTSVLNAASAFNMSSVIQTARQYYANNWQTAPTNIQTVILRTVARWATSDPGDTLFDDLIGQYIVAADMGQSSVVSRIAGALSAPRDRILLNKTLSLVFSGNVRVGDRVSLIAGVAANPFGRDMAWNFIKQNWDQLNKDYGSGGFDLSTIVSSSGEYFTTQEYLNDVSVFFTQLHPVPGAVHDVTQALESVGARSLWRSSGDAAEVCGWLSGR